MARKNRQRKFRYPVDQTGNLVKAKVNSDFLQYCCESDFEHEYPRRTRQMRKQLHSEICRMKYGVTPDRLAEIKRGMRKQTSFR